MTTDEERREMARKLRFNAGTAPYMNTSDDFAREVFRATMNEAVGDYRAAIDRLAELIEPEPERKAKAKPFPVEKDTGFFDTTKCECGYLNDVSAKYCGQCGGVIEVTHYAD